MTFILAFIAGMLFIPVVKRLKERYRTRNDKGYDASKWRAF